MCAKPLSIHIRDASLHYMGNLSPTLSGLNMTITAQQWTVLLGRSGSGKTTLLRYLAGLLDHHVQWCGTLEVADGDLTIDPFHLRQNIAYMAQQDLLLPWLNVLDNVCLSLRFTPHHDHSQNDQHSQKPQQRALKLLENVGLLEYAEAKPSQLSGGMRQRVALARTLMQDKPVVLMDEPFSALDAVTRHKLQTLSTTLLQDKTVVLITHDPLEAVRLASQLYVLKGQQALRLNVPDSSPPRTLDNECVRLQQSILHQLENDDE